MKHENDIGGSREQYFQEVRRQLGRFILSLGRIGETRAEKPRLAELAPAGRGGGA